jgi:hypothetical protein
MPGPSAASSTFRPRGRPHPAGHRASRGPSALPVARADPVPPGLPVPTAVWRRSRQLACVYRFTIDDGKLLERRSCSDPLSVFLAIVSRRTQIAVAGSARDGSATAVGSCSSHVIVESGQVRANSLNCAVTSCTLFRGRPSSPEDLGSHPDRLSARVRDEATLLCRCRDTPAGGPSRASRPGHQG